MAGGGGVIILASYKFHKYMIIWCEIQVIINKFIPYLNLKKCIFYYRPWPYSRIPGIR